jgi:hypothetical protein
VALGMKYLADADAFPAPSMAASDAES